MKIPGRLFHLLCVATLLAATPALPAATDAGDILYVGTYTGARSKGIYAFRFDTREGRLTPVGLVAETPSPSFLALHPNGRSLYAVNEVNQFEGKKSGMVSAFAIDRATAQLRPLNQQSSQGTGPCHLAVDHTGRTVLVANYGGGSIASLPIDEGGRLEEAVAAIQHSGSSVSKQRQKAPHAHYIQADPKNQFVLACDLGLDQVLSYRLDARTGGLQPNDPPHFAIEPGSGPRHLAFHPNGKWVYVINETSCTISACTYDAERGTLGLIETQPTLPADARGAKGMSTAQIMVHPSGKFVYGSNRGHHSLAVFQVDQSNGKLKLVEHTPTGGKTPRNFVIHPSGQFLIAANQDSDTLTVFRINPSTGGLTPVGEPAAVGMPVSLVFLPAPR